MKVLQTNINNDITDDGKSGLIKNNFYHFIDLGKSENQYLADAIKENNTPTEEQLEQARENGEFIPPWEANSIESSSTGFDKISTNKQKSSNYYFWVEDLHNWCMYTFSSKPGYNNPGGQLCPCFGRNIWHLYVWNGRDAFIPIVNLGMPNNAEIKNWQVKFLNKCRKIICGRGNNHIWMEDGENSTAGTWNNYTQPALNDGSPQIIIHGIIIEKNRKYSINDPENYQTIRCSSPGSSNESNTSLNGSNDYEKSYLHPLIRQGMPTGCPALWRLSTGELCLCTYLVWGGNTDVNGKNQIDFINQICRESFGSGSDKTIKDDWLKEKEPNKNDEIASNISDFSIYKSTLKNTQVDQNNKMTKDLAKLTFNINDINVSIKESKDDDLVSRW